MIKNSHLYFWRSPYVFTAAFLTAAMIFIMPLKAAAASGSMYFTDSSATSGSDLYVKVRENSSTQPVNAVEADFTYPASMITYDGIDNTGSAFEVDASETGGSGSVSIQVGTATPKTGDNLVATVHFTLSGSGVSTLAFQNTSELVNDGTYLPAPEKDNAVFYGTYGPLVSVYRFYNYMNGEHFYTADPAERDAVEHLGGWQLEGVAFDGVPSDNHGAVPIYRFNNNYTGEHFYTADPAERNALESTRVWQYEGIGFYEVLSGSNGATPLYRLYNNSVGGHFYTSSVSERDNILRYPGWGLEGIGFYVF